MNITVVPLAGSEIKLTFKDVDVTLRDLTAAIDEQIPENVRYKLVYVGNYINMVENKRTLEDELVDKNLLYHIGEDAELYCSGIYNNSSEKLTDLKLTNNARIHLIKLRHTVPDLDVGVCWTYKKWTFILNSETNESCKSFHNKLLNFLLDHNFL